MTLPVAQKIWTISANNRITFVSLNDTMGQLLKGWADFLLAHGYTCKGSSNGAAAAMDGVNRWATAANAATRGANTVTANSWMVLTDGNSANICLSYVGASDDIARIAFSPAGSYVVAGTATFTPTATDEQVLWTVSVIGTTTSLDRIWFGWVDSTSKLCRFLILRDSALIGPVWGVELVSSRVTVAFSPAIWGFAYNNANFCWGSGAGAVLSDFAANTRGGKTRINSVSVNVGGGAEVFLNSATGWQSIKPELQKAIGAPMFPMSIGSAVASNQGPVGDLFDWYSGQGTAICGNTYPNMSWIEFGIGTQASPGQGIAWPWDGSTIAQVA